MVADLEKSGKEKGTVLRKEIDLVMAGAKKTHLDNVHLIKKPEYHIASVRNSNAAIALLGTQVGVWRLAEGVLC